MRVLTALHGALRWMNTSFLLPQVSGSVCFQAMAPPLPSYTRKPMPRCIALRAVARTATPFTMQTWSGAPKERLETETSLRRALQNGELKLYYQPQVDLQGNLKGMEALLRWQHPKRGLIPPADFIPIAEETGLIVPIGSWVIREACRQCAEWHQTGYKDLKIAVNVSALQFYFSDLLEIVSARTHAIFGRSAWSWS